MSQYQVELLTHTKGGWIRLGTDDEVYWNKERAEREAKKLSMMFPTLAVRRTILAGPGAGKIVHYQRGRVVKLSVS